MSDFDNKDPNSELINYLDDPEYMELRKRLVSTIRPRKMKSNLFAENPIESTSEEFNRISKEALRKEGFVRTKNFTLLKIIK